MNRLFTTVWSFKLNSWVVASEHTSRHGKRGGSGRRLIGGVGFLGLTFLSAGFALAADLPTGGQIVHGNGQISTPGSNQMVIDQTSNKLAIDWNSFNISSGNKVTFDQPGSQSIALNRVLGSDGSKIMGTLEANGRVFLINPNGILFGAGASVDVGGLVASTLDLSVDDFKRDRYRFKGDGSNSSVDNHGVITAAEGGAIALLGGTVSNNGTLVANQGSVALAAGNTVTLDFAGDGLLNVQIDEAVMDALVENHQLIQADGGQVLLTANAGEALLKTVVNNTGVIEAHTLGEKDGKIVLLGGFDGGTTLVAGTLDASAPLGGDGGFIETSGAHVKIADGAKVTTKANTGRSGTWLIDPNDFTVAVSGGDMTGTAVSQALSDNGSFIIETASMGAAGGNGDIHINDGIAWNTSSTLTLKAERDININANINSAGAGNLALEYGQGAVADGNGAEYHLNQGAKVSLSAGDNFSTKLGSDGTTRQYRVITELGIQGSITGADLQGINGNPSGNYVLGADIDASTTAGWNDGLGFAQLGAPWWSGFGEFSGTLDGLGHQISGLTINRPGTSDVGLFRILSADSRLRNLGLVGGAVIGGTKVGGLAGVSYGKISDVYTTGEVFGGYEAGGLVGFNYGSISNAHATGKVAGIDYVGGLVGNNSYGSTIINAYATGAVTGSDYVGGLVGHNHYSASINISPGPAISNAYATGTVTGDDYVGGLVGYNRSGIISNAYAIGTVVGSHYIGGLVGYNDFGFGTITIANAYATGTVTGIGYVGGLVGQSSFGSTINHAHATGAVEGDDYVGGLVGLNGGTTSHAYATGAVTGSDYVGGLLGSNGGAISNAHAIGAVEGNDYVGGLVGLNGGTTSHAYASGAVTGSDYVGGLLGSNGGAISNAHATGVVEGNDYVGGLVGLNQYSKTSHAYATGAVVGRDYVGGLIGYTDSSATNSIDGISFANAAGAVTGRDYVGGLVGYNHSDTISSAYATGIVKGSYWVGGLVGYDNSYGATISNVYASGMVMGHDDIGGLIGYSLGSIISDAYATGMVAGNGNVGGLVGQSGFGSKISNAYATGTVTGSLKVGGLIGHSYGELNNAYATGAVIGEDDVGGLVGRNNGWYTLSNVYAKGAVTGQNQVGGLVGRSEYATIMDAYATGAVDGINYVGGLVGYGNDSRIRNAFALGEVAGQYAIGGLAGANWGEIGNSFYAITDRAGASINNSGVPTDIFGGNNLGTAATFADLTSLSTFANSGWDIDGLGGTSSSWRIYEGNSTPLLRSFLKAVTVTLENPSATSSKVYDGNIASDSFNYVTDQPAVILDGVASYTSASANVGSYSVRDGTLRYGFFSDQQGYDIKVVGDPSLAITPKALTLSGLTANDKVYDGNNVATLSGGSLNGLVGDETLSLSGLVGTFADKQAGINKVVTVTGGLGNGSGLVSNYSFTNPTGLTASIDRANLTVTANNANKTYDGQAWSGGNGLSYDGFVSGEDASVLGGAALYGGNAQGARDVGFYTISVDGLMADNYTIRYQDGMLEITRRPISVTPSYGDVLASLQAEGFSGQHIDLYLGIAASGEHDRLIENGSVIDSGIRLPEGL